MLEGLEARVSGQMAAGSFGIGGLGVPAEGQYLLFGFGAQAGWIECLGAYRLWALVAHSITMF